MNHSLDPTFDENNNERKSSENIRRNLKMVSRLNAADTSKEYRLEMTFVNFYGLRNNIMITVRMSYFDIVMQLVVCKILLICLILMDGKTKKISVNLCRI